MGRHLLERTTQYPEISTDSAREQVWSPSPALDLGEKTRWVALSALVGALAAISLPGAASQTAGMAVILAVGAIALLAGHRWSLMIVVAAQVLILGKVWPIALHGSGMVEGAAIVASLCALPSLVLLRKTVPTILELLVGKRAAPVNTTAYRACSVLVGVWLLLPVLS